CAATSAASFGGSAWARASSTADTGGSGSGSPRRARARRRSASAGTTAPAAGRSAAPSRRWVRSCSAVRRFDTARVRLLAGGRGGQADEAALRGAAPRSAPVAPRHPARGGRRRGGDGPLAGPVVAAAVVLPPGAVIEGLADSKVLTAPARERLDAEIRRCAVAIGLGVVEPAEIDRLNIYRAGLRAMARAVAALAPVVPGFVLVDGREIPELTLPQSAYPKGDSFVASIA